MSSILGLREFLHMRWNPRTLLVDAREDAGTPSRPLDNPFFSWVRIRSRAQVNRLASDISQRHLVIIHEDPETALDLDHIFKSLEIHSAALEDGERGWLEAIIEECTSAYGDTLLVTLNQLAYNRRQYLIVRGAYALALQPSGSIAAIREEARHQGARIQAVVDTGQNQRTAASLAQASCSPHISAAALQMDEMLEGLGGLCLRRDGPNSLRIFDKTFSLSVTTGEKNQCLKETCLD